MSVNGGRQIFLIVLISTCGLAYDLRTYQLTGLTNAAPYTVTLSAVQSGSPVMADTVVGIPSDTLTFLAVINR